MLREQLLWKDGEIKKGFRWRGQQVSRVEGFSDAVFAFALTLLVVSLEIPQSYTELLNSMRGFFAFAICFAMLAGIWYSHYIYFRRYGLDDALTVFFNALLLFVILFYVYPLKFLFSILVNQFFGIDAIRVGQIGAQQMPSLMMIYSGGVVALFGIFVLLYLRAYHLRDELELNEIEVHYTKGTIIAHSISMAIGIISVLIAWIWPTKSALSGLIYFLMGPLQGFWGWRTGYKGEKLLINIEIEPLVD